MATRIINQANGKSQATDCAAVVTPAVNIETENAEEASCSYGSCPGQSCTRCVEFCETMTLNAPFNASGINAECARIAYDPSFLGYTVEPETVQAELPCGGCCPVEVYRIGLTGAIPYIIDVGPVTSQCGASVRLGAIGNVMVDEMIGYICGGDEPQLTELGCANVIPHVRVTATECGNSDSTNITVHGTFCFSGLPTCM